MMIDLNKILFLPLDLPRIEIPYDSLIEVYKGLSTKDTYRNCRHIAIYTHHGRPDAGVFKKDLLDWTPIARKYFPELIQYTLDNIATWMSPLGRIAIVCTPPDEENPPHIDCAKGEFSSLQLKYRQVLHGNSDDLWFLTNRNELQAPMTTQPFLMDGSWPHRMLNTSGKVKFTLAIGNPWPNQSSNNPFLKELVGKSSCNSKPLLKDSIQLCDNYEKLFFSY